MSTVVPKNEIVNGSRAEKPEPTASSAGLIEAPRLRRPTSTRKYIASIAIWFLYVPHYAVLRLLGPRFGMYWVRIAANAHWLLTFVGAQSSARRSLEKFYPLLGTKLSVSQLLRRHLELKHECFARVRVYSLHGAQGRVSDIRWRANPGCESAIPKMDGRDRGLVIVGYHFGFYQLSAIGLSQVVPGCNPVQLRYRIAACAEQAMSPMARLVMRRAIEADRRSGAPIFYIDANTSIRQLYRLLRGAGCLSLAADGMSADDFMEVPFFDGTLRVPIGWARLAAATSSDVLMLYDTQIDRHHREGWFFNHVGCSETSAEVVRRAVTEVIRTLESAIRREPWGWHPWQRLRWEQGADGSPRYFLQPFGDSLRDSATPKSESQMADRSMNASTSSSKGSKIELASSAPDAEVPANGKNSKSQRVDTKHVRTHGRPRVAIVCNSLTPYRIHLHERIVAEVPEIELWSVTTHANAYNRWTDQEVPTAIRPIHFGHGEPTNEQAQMRFAAREWQKGGRIIEWLNENNISAVLCQGCGDLGRLRILHHCYRLGIPCFLYGDFNICGDRLVGPKRWLKRAVYGTAVKWSTGLMPCGIRGKELFARYGGGKKPHFLFPFVPDLSAFENPSPETVEELRQRIGLDPDRRRIIFSARMMHAKRPDLAIQAFVKIADERPEWDLLMLGDGELRAALEQQVPSSLRKRILWAGFLHNAREVASLYALSDVLLLPSEHEPWGVVVAEAAAAGMTIVASNVVGAAPELVHDRRNGYRFLSGDCSLLVQALRSCTSADFIDKGKQQSRALLREWIAEADPVDGFRAALGSCGLIAEPESSHITNRQLETPRPQESVLAPIS
jgi:glycosyltransferase involved in cell wall biosynthesis/lauroyl/myristoyl acyltransferase